MPLRCPVVIVAYVSGNHEVASLSLYSRRWMINDIIVDTAEPLFSWENDRWEGSERRIVNLDRKASFLSFCLESVEPPYC